MDVRKIKGSALVAAGVMLTMTACGPESSTTGNADVTTAAAGGESLVEQFHWYVPGSQD